MRERETQGKKETEILRHWDIDRNRKRENSVIWFKSSDLCGKRWHHPTFYKLINLQSVQNYIAQISSNIKHTNKKKRSINKPSNYCEYLKIIVEHTANCFWLIFEMFWISSNHYGAHCELYCRPCYRRGQSRRPRWWSPPWGWSAARGPPPTYHHRSKDKYISQWTYLSINIIRSINLSQYFSS